MADSDVTKWLDMIKSYEREFKRWENQVQSIIKRYRDDSNLNNTGGAVHFNILWSNVQTTTPAVYSRTPKASVSRRFSDNDPIGRVASMLLERALDYDIEHYGDFTAAMGQSVLDRFLGGRGTTWVRYEPHVKAVQENLPTDGMEVSEDQDEPNEELDYECAPSDYVHWRDFGHNVARTWEEVTTVWREVYMDRAQLVERFGEKLGSTIPLDTSPEDIKRNKPSQVMTADGQQALIYEIWDKPSKTAIWISKSLGEILDERDDPAEYEGFFPCPKPLYATTTNESLIPIPDFKLYQDQANELDILTDRIDGLIKALQVKGVYNSSEASLARLFTEGGNGTLIPVTNWAAFAEKNGLKGAIDMVDITPIAEALLVAYKAVEEVKNQIYDITGISDIVRGQSVASETATAQQIKGQYASLRLKNMQTNVALYASGILRLKAQTITTKFQPETILKMAAADQLSQEDQQLIPQAIGLLKNKVLRNFRIEVAADSLVQADENAEQQRRSEFLTAVGGFLTNVTPVIQAEPKTLPLFMEMLKFGVTGFRAGKQIEGAIDAFADQAKQAAMAPPQPPPPPPEQIKAQADMQMHQQTLQADMQKNHMDNQTQLQKAQIDNQASLQKQAMVGQQGLQQTALKAKLTPPPIPGAQ